MEKYLESPMGLAEDMHDRFEDEILGLIKIGKMDGRFPKKKS